MNSLIVKKILNYRNFLYLLNPITIFYAIPLFFIIYILSPFILIRWYKLQSLRIGHLLEDTTLYICKKENNYNVPNKPYIDLFYETKLKSNKFLSTTISKKIIVFPRLVVEPIDKLQKKLKNIFPKLRRFEAYRKRNKKDGYQFINHIKNNQIKFTNEEIKKGKFFLNSLGIHENDEIVCINIHDGNYLKKIFPNINFDHHKMRNSNIENYEKGIMHLINLGYFVIRMGKHTNKKCKIKDHKFIDYSKLENQSDFLDIFLISKSKFYISNCTGLDHVAIHFQKPMIQIHPTIEPFDIENNFILLLSKHHLNKNTKKLMTLSEIINANCFFYGKKQEWFDKNQIEIIENKSDEIKDIMDEMHLLITNNLNLTIEDKKLQKLFWEKYCDYGIIKRINLDKNQKSLIEYYHNNTIHSMYSINFLKKNKFWLN